jgi:glycosyltransferase involved in cell wall biosynthesis
MKILALPRDPNPYQTLLYSELERLGASVRYLGELTPSRTLNLLLLPFETIAGRITGARVVHLHWVFYFRLPGSQRFPVLRLVMEWWFTLWLGVVHHCGMRLAWTAHNVLPHARVFADDVAARRSLVEHSDVVFAHSRATLDALTELGAGPRRSLVIRHGPMGPGPVSLRTPGTGGRRRQFLFFGKVAEYKGIDELLEAYAGLPAEASSHLTIAGQCDDPELRARLTAASDVRLRIERIPDEEIAQLMSDADAVVLPFRRITTSGSAELALAHGRPLIIPDLPGLAELPDAAVTRYDGSVDGLAAALADLANATPSHLASMSEAALAYSAQASWEDIASAMLSELESILTSS